ncbi:unnamed protein product [Mesocestoides corti]|uniref:inositol-phosphate phosphatase n=1 Tax=Mesocestoides corti TaxID=53468 RepID=A0A0R3U292_MESCO|nr:unnamed protein product [Mesocestoides corti]
MVQISLTKKGIFVLVVGAVTFVLFLLSNGASPSSRADYEINPDVVSVRSIFVAVVSAVEEAGSAIKKMHNLSMGHLKSRTKSSLLKLDTSSGATSQEVVTEADLVSGYCIVRRLKLLRPDISSQVRSEERELPSHSALAVAMASSLSDTEAAERRRVLLSQLREQDLFLHLRQLSFWVDPLDATQEFSENLLQYVSVMVCASIHGEPVFGVVHFPFLNSTYWTSMGGQLSVNLQNVPGAVNRPTTPVRVLVSRSHTAPHLGDKVQEAFGPTPIEIIPAGGSGYKLIELALGNADLYIHVGGARRWDLCAPSAILHARGGVVRTMADTTRGFQFSPNDPDAIDDHSGVFAAASRSLFDKWAPTVARLYRSTFLSPPTKL